LVVLQELAPVYLVLGVVGQHVQACPQQAAGALRSHGAQGFVGQGAKPLAVVLLIGCRSQVGGGIGQGAVEIEPDESFHGVGSSFCIFTVASPASLDTQALASWILMFSAIFLSASRPNSADPSTSST